MPHASAIITGKVDQTKAETLLMAIDSQVIRTSRLALHCNWSLSDLQVFQATTEKEKESEHAVLFVSLTLLVVILLQFVHGELLPDMLKTILPEYVGQTPISHRSALRRLLPMLSRMPGVEFLQTDDHRWIIHGLLQRVFSNETHQVWTHMPCGHPDRTDSPRARRCPRIHCILA